VPVEQPGGKSDEYLCQWAHAAVINGCSVTGRHSQILLVDVSLQSETRTPARLGIASGSTW